MESEATATCVKERKAEVQSMGDCFQVMGDINAHTSLQARGNKVSKKKNTGSVMTTAASDMFLQDAIRFVHSNVTLPTRRGRFNMPKKNDCQCGSDCYLRRLGDQRGNHCSHSTLDYSLVCDQSIRALEAASVDIMTPILTYGGDHAISLCQCDWNLMSGKGFSEEGQKVLRPKHFNSEEVSSAQWDTITTAMTDSPRLKALEEKMEKATTNEKHVTAPVPGHR